MENDFLDNIPGLKRPVEQASEAPAEDQDTTEDEILAERGEDTELDSAEQDGEQVDDEIAELEEETEALETEDELAQTVSPEIAALQQQLAALTQQLNAEKQGIQQKQEQGRLDDLLNSLKDKDYIDGNDVADAIGQALSLQAKDTPTGDVHQQSEVSNQWVTAQRDYQQVAELVQADPALAQQITSIPTNDAGMLLAVRNHKMTAELARKEKVIQDLQAKVKRQGRGRVPQTGPSQTAARKAGTGRQPPVSRSIDALVQGLNARGGGLRVEHN